MTTELEQAWEALSTPTRRVAGTSGQPSYHLERDEWLYAFAPAERPVIGARSREWTAKASTEVGVVREMARCLRELSEGRAPR